MISKGNKKIEKKREKTYCLTDYYIFSILVIFPLYIHNLYFDIVNAKFFFFAIISLTYMVFLFFDYLEKYSEKSMEFRVKYSEIGILLFLLSNIISYLVNGCMEDGLWGWESRRMGILPIALFCAIYIIIGRVYRFRISHIYGFGISCIIIYVLAILQNLGFDPFYFRKEVAVDMQSMFVSTIGNTNFFGSFVCLSYSFFLVFFCICKGCKEEVIGGLLVFLGASSIVASGNNGVLIAVIVPVLIVAILLLQKKVTISRFLNSTIISLSGFLFMFFLRKMTKTDQPIDSIVSLMERYWTVLFIGLVPFALLSYVLRHIKWQLSEEHGKGKRANKKVKETKQKSNHLIVGFSIVCCLFTILFLVISQKNGWIADDFGNNRGFIWNRLSQQYQSFRLINQLLGIGPEAVQKLFINYYQEEMNQIFGGVVNAAHNEYLNYLITSGVLGLLSYFFFLLSSIKEGISKSGKNWYRYAFLAGAITYLLNATVNIAQPITTPFLFLFLAIVSSNCDSDLIEEV